MMINRRPKPKTCYLHLEVLNSKVSGEMFRCMGRGE